MLHFFPVSNPSFQISQGSYVFLHPTKLTGLLFYCHYLGSVLRSWDKYLIWEVIPENTVREGDRYCKYRKGRRRHRSNITTPGWPVGCLKPFWVIFCLYVCLFVWEQQVILVLMVLCSLVNAWTLLANTESYSQASSCQPLFTTCYSQINPQPQLMCVSI